MARPAPSAAANGSLTRSTRCAPAASDSRFKLSISTGVAPFGTQMTIWERLIQRRSVATSMKWRRISRAASKWAMTPSRSGRMTSIVDGTRPSMPRALSP